MTRLRSHATVAANAIRSTVAATAIRSIVTCAIIVFFVDSAAASPAQDYMLYCMGCHGAQAAGVPGKVPPLANTLGRFMRSPAGRNYVLRVPGAANSALSDAQLAAVLNWVAEKFNAGELSRDVPRFTTEEVSRLRHVPLSSVQATRSQVVKGLAATGAAPPAQY